MALLERLRLRWRHPDAAVRLAAVRDMTPGDEPLAELAERDPDPHVRRAALKRLDDPALLERLAAAETDPPLRDLAAARALELITRVAASDRPIVDCEAALGRLHGARELATVAITAHHAAVRHVALERITDAHALRDVVRRATDPDVARAALDRIRDAATLRSLAVATDCPTDLALRALERLDDPEALRAVAERRDVPKAVRQRARARLAEAAGDRPPLAFRDARARQLALCTTVQALTAERDLGRAAERVREAEREWDELARVATPREDVAARFRDACREVLDGAARVARRQAEAEAARAAVESGLAARERLCERVEGLDGADVPRELAAARQVWRTLPELPAERVADLARRFAKAAEAALARHEAWRTGDARRSRLESLVLEAEALAEADPPPPARAWHALEARLAALEAPSEGAEEAAALRARFAAAGARLEQRREEAERERQTRQQQNLARLEKLCARLEELAAAAHVKLGTARRELSAADAALADRGPLPPAERRAAWSERLGAARDALARRVAQDEEIEQWRRWANAGAQEDIIRRIEGILEKNDLAEGVRLLARVADDWAQVATAPEDRAQELWQRFRTVRDELRRRCDACMAENLARKQALCDEIAAVGDSTAWKETTELIRRLQEEWKAIGPVPPRHAQALWRRFREPCDRFFARRREHFDRVDATRRTHVAQKTALCEQAEALGDSTDWDATAAVLKRLQAEWKKTGPVPRAEGEALWQRFRAACDRFFERRSRREEIEREDALRRGAALCERLEALGGDGAPEAVGPEVDAVWAEWLQLDLGAGADARTLRERLDAALAALVARRPEALQGTRLDPAATLARREKLCARLEKLIPAAPAQPASLREMALALRERLAANTIGGGAARAGGGGRQAAQELERIERSWANLGPPVGPEARALAERFARARAAVAGGA